MKKLILSLFMIVCIAASVIAQTRTITGTITSSDDNQPIPGVSIKIRGTQAGAITDAAGKYSLTIPSGSTTIEFSYIGYVTQSRPIGSSGSINVVLTPDAKVLGEVVITALGIEASKDKLGTSQSTVKGSAIQASGETSILTGLSGKASGVQVVRTGGDPGAGAYIQIRGQSTITGDLQPLIVIDGVPVSNSSLGSGVDGVAQQSRLSDVNPEDIESTEILKGASASALWGTRAANGVILITTKKGRSAEGKLNISFNSTYSLDVLNKSADLQTEFGQGAGGLFGNRSSNSRSWGDRISERAGGTDVAAGTDYLLLPDGSKRFLVVNGTTANPHGGKNSKEVYDHTKDLFHNGHYLDNTLAFSGSDATGNYYLSLSNLDQTGILKAGSDYSRKSARFNAEKRFGKVSISSGLTYSNVFSNRVQQGSNTSGIFLGGLRSAPDFDNSIYEGTYVDANGALFPNRQVSYRNPIGSATNSGYDNPFWILNRITSNSRVNRFIGTVEGKVQATDWLQFVARAGLDSYSDYRQDNFPTISTLYPGGSLTVQELSETQFNTDIFLRATRKISSDINFSGIFGFNFNNRVYENTGATARNFILPDAPFDLNNSAASARFPFNDNELIRTAANYAQLSFDLYDQFFVELTGRAENSNTFASTFFYPSASLAWQFTKLPAFTSTDVLSFGKLRVSYGEVGVQPRPYGASTYFNTASITESYGSALDGSSATYGGGYLRSTVQGNPDLKPERKKEFEVGTDLRFFNDKLNLSGTFYSNKTVDAIFAIAVPGTTGYLSRNANAASLQNRGVELDLSSTWIKTKDFSWTTAINWSKNKNKVTELKGVKSFFLNGFAGTSSRAVEGYALGALWGTDWDKDADGKLILDSRGFPQAAPQESVIGDPNPDWQAGITNTIKYKKFSVSFLFDRVQGGDVWNGTKGALITFGTAAATGNTVVSSTPLLTSAGVTIPANTPFRGNIQDFGSGPVALTESWYTGLGGGFGAVASQFIEDGTRTRLREASVGYSISGDRFRKSTKLQSIDFSLTGRNLVLWTDYSGIDPETNLTGTSNGRGLDYFNNPSTRSFLFSVKINY